MIADPMLALALASTLVPIVACIAAGSAVAPGRLCWPGADMLVGFGVLSIVLTGFAVTTRIPLSWLMAGLAILSVIALLIRRQLPGGSSTWIALALVSPILVIAAGHDPAMWDDFWNWLPSAAYEYRHNSLPWPDLAPSFSMFPGYPQGMPLMTAAASFVRGRFLEVAGPVINVLLLAGSSALLAEALAATLVRNERLQATKMPPVLVAGAVVITILLNPGLRGDVVLSSYADCGTMVAVGALGLLGVEILARLSARDAANVEGLAWRFGFVGAMLVNLKQANPVLLALVTAGLILVALRHPPMRTRRALMLLARMLGPGIVLFALWRWYVMLNISDSEKSFLPFDSWNFAVLRQTFAAIGGVIADAPLVNALMWLVTAAGIVFFFQLPGRASEARWLAVVCATVWLGYNAFLIIIYLGVMTEYEAKIAADYWRYTPHVALIGLYAPVMALATASWPAWVKPRSVVATLAVVLLALCATLVRSDLNNPEGRAWQHFLRNAAADMRRVIPAGSKLLIVPYWQSSPFGVAVRYNLWRPGAPEEQIVATILDPNDFAKVASWAARGEVNYLIIQDAEGLMNEETDTLGLPRLNHELVLFVWRDGAWHQVKSWPVPPALIVRDQNAARKGSLVQFSIEIVGYSQGS
jgi:hypothetical protein